jgi:hypothetical protein
MTAGHRLCPARDDEAERIAVEVFSTAAENGSLTDGDGQPAAGATEGSGTEVPVEGSLSLKAHFPLRTSLHGSGSNSLYGGESELAQWDRRFDVANALAGLLQLNAAENAPARCHVGGKELIVRLWKDERGLYVLRVDAGWAGRRSLALAQAFAIHTAGRLITPPTKASLVLWKLRMLVELGFLKASPVALLPLPSGALPSARRVWEELPYLLAIRALFSELPLQPFVLVSAWFDEWAGLPDGSTGTGREWLESSGLLKREGFLHGGERAAFPRDPITWSVELAEEPKDGDRTVPAAGGAA